ncbi:hypothetical protein DsansV1_C02g0019301 [Dioscorea sansibarensis]
MLHYILYQSFEKFFIDDKPTQTQKRILFSINQKQTNRHKMPFITHVKSLD